MKSSWELELLQNQYNECKRKILSLQSEPLLSSLEAKEIRRLKKLKLQTKDRIWLLENAN